MMKRVHFASSLEREGAGEMIEEDLYNSTTQQTNAHLQLINLPDDCLEAILSNLSYDEISKYRIVCRQFNQICKKLLNRGFNLVEKYHAQCLRTIKSKLPRRESKRRSHPLMRHYDILKEIEPKISLLSTTYIKYVNLDVCFIPGKVIDEIFRVLRLIRETEIPPREDILQEVRDISSMAIEHFDEKVLPDLKHNIRASSMIDINSSMIDINSSMIDINSYDLPGGAMISHGRNINNCTLPHCNRDIISEKLNLKKTLKKLNNDTKKNKIFLLTVKNEVTKMRRRIRRQEHVARRQNLKLHKQAKKIQDQETLLAEVQKLLEEQKLVDLTTEVREGTQNRDSLENRKRKTNIINTDAKQTNELQAKKRKLIVERKRQATRKM